MIRYSAWCLALLLAAILSGTAVGFAGTMVEGTVMSSGGNALFIVGDSGEHLEFSVPSGTPVLKNGQTAKLEALQSRDFVSIVTSQTGKDLVATHVFARSPY